LPAWLTTTGQRYEQPGPYNCNGQFCPRGGNYVTSFLGA